LTPSIVKKLLGTSATMVRSARPLEPMPDEIEDEGGHVGEDRSLLVIEEVEIGGLVGLGGGGALNTDGHEAVGVFDGERTEEEDVGEGEDGGVGADAESEGEDGDEGEAGGLAQHAQGVADVLEEGLHFVASGDA
jgi:hypothetical protein